MNQKIYHSLILLLFEGGKWMGSTLVVSCWRCHRGGGAAWEYGFQRHPLNLKPIFAHNSKVPEIFWHYKAFHKASLSSSADTLWWNLRLGSIVSLLRLLFDMCIIWLHIQLGLASARILWMQETNPHTASVRKLQMYSMLCLRFYLIRPDSSPIGYGNRLVTSLDITPCLLSKFTPRTWKA